MSTARQARTWQQSLSLPPRDLAEDLADGRDAPARPAHRLLAACRAGASIAAECRDSAGGSRAPDGLPARIARSRDRETDGRSTLGDVARLRSMRAHLKAIDNAHGGGAALPMATWYLRDEILPLLYAHGGDPITRALIEVVAEVEQDVGWMAYDAGKQYLATGYFTSALRLAHAAGNRLLGGRILAAMSHQAIYLGNRRQAIDFAQAARNLTRQVATPRVIAMEAAMEACAHAAAGDAGQCHRALGRRSRIRGAADHRPGSIRTGWTSTKAATGPRGPRLPGPRRPAQGRGMRGEIGGPVPARAQPHARPAHHHPGNRSPEHGRSRRRRRGRGTGRPRGMEPALWPRVRRGRTSWSRR